VGGTYYFCGGGGGACYYATGSGSGTGGDGGGGDGNKDGNGNPGTINTGGGGGGAKGGGLTGGAGGSGIVIIWYKTDGSDGINPTGTTGGSISTSGDYTVHTFIDASTTFTVTLTTPPSTIYLKHRGRNRLNLNGVSSGL
jgi:hypothetical protein